MPILNKRIRLVSLVFAGGAIAVCDFCLPQSALAEEQSKQQQSVYDASTTAPETVQIKSLNKEEFSEYAAEICEKYGFDGPKEVTTEDDRVKLLNKLRTLRKEKFKELSDPKVRENEADKKQVLDQMKSLTDEIKSFPFLTITLLPPKMPYGALTIPLSKNQDNKLPDTIVPLK